MSHKLFITSDISIDERLVDVAEESSEAALLWPWLLTALDDWGRATADAKRLKYGVFPAIASVTPQGITDALALFARVGLITLYEVDGKVYFAVPSETWFKYQTHIRSEKRESDKSRYPAPPCAQVRENARECAQVRALADNSQPSPSPSPSPSPTPSPSSSSEREASDAAASHTRTHAHEAHADRPTEVGDDGDEGDLLVRETETTLARWQPLSRKQRARLPSPDALHGMLVRHHQRGMSLAVLHGEIIKLEDEAAAATPLRPLTLARLDNWLNQWHAPPPASATTERQQRTSLRRGLPEPPAMIPASKAREWWNDVPPPLHASVKAAEQAPDATSRAAADSAKDSAKPPGRAADVADVMEVADLAPRVAVGVIDLAAAAAERQSERQVQSLTERGVFSQSATASVASVSAVSAVSAGGRGALPSSSQRGPTS